MKDPEPSAVEGLPLTAAIWVLWSEQVDSGSGLPGSSCQKRSLSWLPPLSETWGFRLQKERSPPLPWGAGWGDQYDLLCPGLSGITRKTPHAGKPLNPWQSKCPVPSWCCRKCEVTSPAHLLCYLAHVTYAINTDFLALPQPQPSPESLCVSAWL